jgi:YHS domain-containing protein
MKKMVMVFLAVVLVLSVVGAVVGAEPSTVSEKAGPLEKGKPQTSCPVMGGKVNQQVYADYQGQRVYFCCPACIEMFKKDPEKYLKKLREPGVRPEPSPGGK